MFGKLGEIPEWLMRADKDHPISRPSQEQLYFGKKGFEDGGVNSIDILRYLEVNSIAILKDLEKAKERNNNGCMKMIRDGY